MGSVLIQTSCALTLVLLVCCPAAWGWRSFKIIFTRFDFESNANYVDTKIQIQNASETSINAVVNVLEPLDDVNLAAAILLENDEGNYTALLNRSVHFCKMLRQRNSEPILRNIYEDLARHGKFFKECPIQKGSYSVHEYRIDEEMLPSYLPETHFKVTIRLTTTKGVSIFKGELYGQIDKSKGFNNLKMFSLGR